MDIGREVNITTPDVMGNETEDHMDVDEDQIVTEHPHDGAPGRLDHPDRCPQEWAESHMGSGTSKITTSVHPVVTGGGMCR